VAALRPIASEVDVVGLADGEEHKVWASIERILDALVERRADRRAMLVALGGGVVGDLAGFAAACYMRGIDCVQVPTTLLAQVDSSVGGKTAVNHARGKNMIGAFHQPIRVVSDLDTLRTLPLRELRAGLAEVIKYGIACDAGFLGWIEDHVEALVARDPAALGEAIRRSCEIKAAVVSADEREGGRREILNFGHTLGHAIEATQRYQGWLHGEAVAAGMSFATRLSVRIGLVPAAVAERVDGILERAGLPVRPPREGADRYLEAMRSDKKALQGRLRFVLLQEAGAAVVQPVDDAAIGATLAEVCAPAVTY